MGISLIIYINCAILIILFSRTKFLNSHFSKHTHTGRITSSRAPRVTFSFISSAIYFLYYTISLLGPKICIFTLFFFTFLHCFFMSFLFLFLFFLTLYTRNSQNSTNWDIPFNSVPIRDDPHDYPLLPPLDETACTHIPTIIYPPKAIRTI